MELRRSIFGRDEWEWRLVGGFLGGGESAVETAASSGGLGGLSRRPYIGGGVVQLHQSYARGSSACKSSDRAISHCFAMPGVLIHGDTNKSSVKQANRCKCNCSRSFPVPDMALMARHTAAMPLRSSRLLSPVNPVSSTSSWLSPYLKIPTKSLSVKVLPFGPGGPAAAGESADQYSLSYPSTPSAAQTNTFTTHGANMAALSGGTA